jgi:hypothetical protein
MAAASCLRQEGNDNLQDATALGLDNAERRELDNGRRGEYRGEAHHHSGGDNFFAKQASET